MSVRVNERESVIDALRREVREEAGIDVQVGDLMFAAEVISGVSRQDVELVFAVEPVRAITTPVELLDPVAPGCVVMPPVLEQILAWRDGSLGVGWLGNIYARGIGRGRGEQSIGIRGGEATAAP
ncbi:MAG: hypothetical protein M0T77_09550 [Actinomycetota bacterium]|nr:hypothetical protein [Actinomycetota bacterium]